MSLTIEVEPSLPFSNTLRLEGRLDNDTAKTFDEELEKALDSSVKVLVFDLAKLDYISSAGILSILKAQKAMAARKGKALFGYLQPGVEGFRYRESGRPQHRVRKRRRARQLPRR